MTRQDFVKLCFLFALTTFFIPSSYGHRGRSRRTDEQLDDFDIESSLPRFAQPIPNVTVTVDKDALLPCVVENLRSYKVAWVQVDRQTILSIHSQVISRNPRISLMHSDHRSWFLQIKNVQEADRGWYMCQVNTDPMRSLMGYLEVVVPPEIIDKDTSTDMVVKEGSNVTLTCKAKGHPEPYIMWRREDNQEIQYNGQLVNVIDGELFSIVKISRLNMGAYLCIASNGIPPSISKRIELKVQFPPMIWVPNQLVSAAIGTDVSLECEAEAFPNAINYWVRQHGGDIISPVYGSPVNNFNGKKEKYISVLSGNVYKVTMRLKIYDLQESDFNTTYSCISKNSLGEMDGQIRLYQRQSTGHRKNNNERTNRTEFTTTMSNGRESDNNSLKSLLNTPVQIRKPEDGSSGSAAVTFSSSFILIGFSIIIAALRIPKIIQDIWNLISLD